MVTAEVLIIGGGPGGSSCAWRLCRAGVDVLLIDKAEFPRDKVCAGWITPAVVDELQLDTADYSRDRTFQPITSFRVGLIDGPATDLDYGRPVSYGIRRCEFDHYLLARSGVRTVLGEPVRSIRREAEHWVLNDRYQAPLLIGAGGHFCPVAQTLGDDGGGQQPVVAAQEIEFRLDGPGESGCQVRGDRPELYFCRDLLGYAWCFRKGDYLNVGLGREDRHCLAEHVRDFADWLRRQQRVRDELPGKFRGHAYLLYDHSRRRLSDDGVLLVGDSAGLAYTQSGEGIRPAIESGLMAAETILQSGRKLGVAEGKRYEDEILRRFGRGRMEPHSSGWLPTGLRRLLGRSLLQNAWFARHVVMDRWFLHRDTRKQRPPP
jgi:flavin-dependent dehydrogenase